MRWPQGVNMRLFQKVMDRKKLRTKKNWWGSCCVSYRLRGYRPQGWAMGMECGYSSRVYAVGVLNCPAGVCVKCLAILWFKCSAGFRAQCVALLWLKCPYSLLKRTAVIFSLQLFWASDSLISTSCSSGASRKLFSGSYGFFQLMTQGHIYIYI